MEIVTRCQLTFQSPQIRIRNQKVRIWMVEKLIKLALLGEATELDSPRSFGRADSGSVADFQDGTYCLLVVN
jgi:hypothetical protein